MQREGTPSATTLAAVIALGTTAAVWSWWASAEGGYFGTVMYPGLIVLCAALALVSSRAAWAAGLRLEPPAWVALWALIGLASWSALSAIWSPSPDVAVADAQRIFGYAVAFGLGAWLATLLGRRVHLAMAPLAIAGLFAGGVAVVALLAGDDYSRNIDEGTLQYPLAYRNANAAFFLIALWPSVLLAAERELDWRLRGVAIGTATLCLELAMLSQSRGSVIAGALALVILLFASRERARHVGWLALAVASALVVIPALTELYQTAEIDSYTGTSEMRTAGRAVILGALIATVVGGVAALWGRRRTPSPERLDRANRAIAVGAVALALALAAGFSVVTGNPVGWVEDRVDEFLTQGSPDAEGSSRFAVNAGTERDDLWRIALDVAESDPIVGLGGGGYQYTYLVERTGEGVESVRDAHSVELEVLSELGGVGLALFGAALVGAALGAWSARSVGGGAAALSVCALTASGYWVAHASLDWFWAYPAVTAPVFALLGSACGAAVRAQATDPPGWWGSVPAIAVALLAVSVVPPFLAERYVNSAYESWGSDPARAYDDLDRARDLNRLSIEPLVAEGAIARAMGERDRAIAAFEMAATDRPEEWAVHYFLATLNLREDPERARAELQIALDLNPLSDRLRALRERLDQDEDARAN